TPRRMSDRWRCAGAGGASKAGGTGWPFSTINCMVRCIMRFFEKPKYMITATIKIGAPKIVRKTIPTSGITIAGISSLDFARSASVSWSPIVKLKCRFCFFLIARSISLSGVEAGETVAVATGALAVGDCVGAWAKERAARAVQEMQTMKYVL